MDLFAAALSTYLHAVSNLVVGSYADANNIYLKAVTLDYEGVQVSFQHQIWRIRDDTVCSSQRGEVLGFAKCTQAARAMFQDICHELSTDKQWKAINPRYRMMYCNAAASFKPTIASIGASEEDSPLEAARKECNRATAAAMGSSLPEVAWERAQACKAYHTLRDTDA